jgi:pimeloyl-ACP methyl ester carboxylesterase
MMDRNTKWARLVRKAFDVLGVLFVVFACLSVLYYWDPTRAYYKAFRESDPYLYETIDPRLLDLDPADHIGIHDRAEAENARAHLTRVIWGEAGLPIDSLPDKVEQNILVNADVPSNCDELEYVDTQLKLKCQMMKYKGWGNLSAIDELIVAVGPAYTASFAFFRPEVANGTLVAYQNGYASTYHGQHRYLEELVEKGFSVLATNHIGYGDNYCYLPIEKRPWCDVGWNAIAVPLPMRVHFSPLVTAINHGLRQDGIERVAMIGFSAGGWLTTVLAAVDRRVSQSFSVAGFMPPFIQREDERSPNQNYGPLYEGVSMMDKFVLGASGTGRRQVHFFNRYDRCCFNGTRGLLYKPAITDAVEAIGAGSFEVVIDETHARHKISRWTFNRILAELEEPYE